MMEKSPQSFDVIVVCALAKEVEAFLEVVEKQCEVAIHEDTSPCHGYSYRLATIKNNKGKPLKLHVSWPQRHGPQEMTLHLEHVLTECNPQPRIAIMTQRVILAGNALYF